LAKLSNRAVADDADVGVGDAEETGYIGGGLVVVEGHYNNRALTFLEGLEAAGKLVAVEGFGGGAVGVAQVGGEFFVEAVPALGVAAEIERRHPAHAQDERREFGGIAKAVLAEGLEGGEEDVLGEVVGCVVAAEVAQALGCSASSVYGWAAAGRERGVAGLQGYGHGGGPAALADRAGPLLETLLGQDPQTRGHQATGWTVPLLRTELATAGVAAGERTIRRALHRLGWRWKRPKFVLGRPDPAYAEKRGRS